MAYIKSKHRTEEARQYKKLYNLSAWQALRIRQLTKEPFCRYCEAQGRIVPATIVNHIKPHKGDKVLFFASTNVESVCKQHHDSAIQSFERTGRMRGNGLDGFPLDGNHHWNK